MTLTLKQATIVALLLGICWSKEVWAKKSSFTNRILEELRSQISKETNQNLELSAVSERNLNPMLEKEDTFGQTILINGKEYKPKIPDGSNPMNLETRNLQQEPRQEQRMIKRNFEVDIQKKLWANNKVPYVIIETSFGNNVATAKSLINAAIQQFKESTCVEWVPRTDETYYVKCYATVGFKPFSRGQIINYAAGCLEIESVLHEMYHTIGGNHEVQRLDRSSYLTVLWDNTKQFQFKQYVVDKTFPRYAGQNTLKLKDPELDYLATKPKIGLSYIDIAEINDAYQCTGCGGIITLETGKEQVITIQAYQQGRECTWLFKGGQRSIIRVYVTAVDLPHDSTKQCQHWLEFRDYHIGTPGKK
uniref:Metalloendopeptidase n=1 Tax=Magallana gigas TaxID=29159 RepID=K1Q7C2_MAGGI